MRKDCLAAASLITLFLLSGCRESAPEQPEQPASSAQATSSSHPQPDWSVLPGALVNMTMESTVGVVLDEVPQTEREKFASALLAKPASFWEDRARRQIKLSSLRLSFRNAYYPKGTKWQLPLPPEEQWSIVLHGSPARKVVDGHDAVVIDYGFWGMLLTDEASPGISEPVLAQIGGVWNEPFIFPVDPEFIFQRTGFACFNEGQFPPNSVDAEEADLFYDHGCKVESRLTNTGCHQTSMPAQSCIDAVKSKIGRVQTSMRFERFPWDKALADSVRLGTITNPDGPDLEPYSEEFRQHRFTYRYIPANSCTIIEDCVGGSGWRKLLMFPTADLNIGAKPLDIGLVDYFHQHGGSTLSEHGMFEFSECHGHYHFSHYGTFTLGDGRNALNRKNGFCMQPTARLSNHELSPLNHPYIDCELQGVAPGWIDEYKMGLECQWLDITGVPGNQTQTLSFTTNPDGLICEGKLKLDDQGYQLYEPTNFKTSQGGPVEQPQCDEFPGWLANNDDAYDVQIPDTGDSYVTQPCREGLFGTLRNCGFQNKKTLSECTPGKKVSLACSTPAGSAPHVVRVCEGSRKLQSGIPCTYNDALGSGIVNGSATISFTCPTARDEAETGGAYSFMTSPLFPDDGAAAVTCTQT